MTSLPDISVVLLHESMVDKRGRLVTTSLTLNDIHDFSRSCTTYGVRNVYIAHPSNSIRRLARRFLEHWQTGYGKTYNANRTEALEETEVVYDLDEAVSRIDARTKKMPKLIATSAKDGPGRVAYSEMTNLMMADLAQPYLLMFGTGWGMSEQLLERADYFIKPILGPVPYNHLSVRSACAITLDRLFGKR